jgi:hypothetical protein
MSKLFALFAVVLAGAVAAVLFFQRKSGESWGSTWKSMKDSSSDDATNAATNLADEVKEGNAT